MTNVTVLGGTGFAGNLIAREADGRGLSVTSLSRHAPLDLPDSIHVVMGSLHDPEILTAVTEHADVVVAALSPRGDMAGKLRELYATLADALAARGTRLIVVGGFGSLKAGDGDARISESEDFPEAFRAEAGELLSTVRDLQDRTDALNWTFVSPAADFGAFNTDQERRGHYRVGGDVPLADELGVSNISGADFATAVVDEIERAAHQREHITFAY